MLLEKVQPDELEELIVEAWLRRAPKRVAQAYLEAHPPPVAVPLGGSASSSRTRRAARSPAGHALALEHAIPDPHERLGLPIGHEVLEQPLACAPISAAAEALPDPA